MHGRSWRCDSRTNIFKRCDMSHQYFDWTNIDLGFNFGACFRTSDDRKMLHQYGSCCYAPAMNMSDGWLPYSTSLAQSANFPNEPRHDKTNKVTVRPAKTQISLPIECTAKTLIRLGGCPGWSEFSLGAQSLCLFCHPVWNAAPGNLASFCKLSRRQRCYF